jgi:TPR repeat protein
MRAGTAAAVFLLGIAPCFPCCAQSACSDAGVPALNAGVLDYNGGWVRAAFDALRAAAACGNADAQVNLGYMYARGQGTAPDQQEALRLYRLSAAQGNGEGMNALGYKYQYGTGVAIDLAQAISWYCRAIERGNPRAFNNLALLYDAGQGVPQDVAVARDLWQQAADRGHANGLYNLGVSYLKSADEFERKRGIALEIEAASLGNGPAQQLLRRRGYQGTFPAVLDDAGLMKLQSPWLPPGHAPACGDLVS